MNALRRSALSLSASLALCATAAAQAPAGDACSLLTTDEVGAVLGVKVSRQPVASSKTSCTFTPGSDHSLAARMVTVTLTPLKVFEATKQSYREMTPEPASGIGDEAHYQKLATKHLKAISLYVRKGAGAFVLRVNPGRAGKETDAQVEAMEKTLGQQAAARL